jgi:hypothetical protein
MAVSASERRIRQLSDQLESEKVAHARTRNELQSVIDRTWRLVPSHYIALMGVYPPLRRLLTVLGEAADLQDPSRGAAIEDTMRVDFVHSGEQASSSHPEHALTTHRRHRQTVETLRSELDWFTHKVSKLIPGSPTEYNPPSGECEDCGRPLYQSDTGRPRKTCGSTCRKRASRKERV